MIVFVLQSGLVAVGTHKGLVQIWDAAAQKRVSTIEGHTARVGKHVNLGHTRICSQLSTYSTVFILYTLR